MQFSDILNQEVIVLIPKLDPVKLKVVKVVGVEAGGVWIESQEITNTLLQMLKVSSAPKRPLFFFPYHQITLAMYAMPGTSLDEKAFGL
jgi:hypothetical protein